MTRRVFWNAGVLAGLKIAAPAVSLLIVLAVSRRLGAVGLGRYSIVYAYLTVFGLLGGLGLQTLLVREGARNRQALGRLLSTAMVLGGGISALLALAMLALGRLAGYDTETVRALAVAGLALVPTTWLAYFEAGLLSLNYTLPLLAAAAIEHVFKVGLGIALLYAGYELPAVLLCAAAGKGAACIACWLWLRRLGIVVTAGADREALSSLRIEAPVFALSAICASLYWRADVLVLSWLRGVAEVGYYTAAYRLLDVAILLPQSFCQALYPGLAAGKADPAVAQRGLLLLTVPAALAVALAAGPLVRALYGPSFSAAGPVLALLIWTAVPYAWNRYHAYLLIACDRQWVDLGINAALLALNVALNLLAIPRYGALGAAAVTLGTAIVYGVVQRRYVPARPKRGGRGLIHVSERT